MPRVNEEKAKHHHKKWRQCQNESHEGGGKEGSTEGGVSAGDVHGKLDLDKSDQAFRMVRIHSVSSNFLLQK